MRRYPRAAGHLRLRSHHPGGPRAVVRHLATCPACRDELVGLAGLPALLLRPPAVAAAYSSGHLAGAPRQDLRASLVDGTLGTITQRRRRRRRLAAIAATALTAAAAALGHLPGRPCGAEPGRVGDGPGNRHDRRRHRAHQRRRLHPLLVRPRHRHPVGMRRQLRPALAAGHRPGHRGPGSARRHRHHHPPRPARPRPPTTGIPSTPPRWTPRPARPRATACTRAAASGTR